MSRCLRINQPAKAPRFPMLKAPKGCHTASQRHFDVLLRLFRTSLCLFCADPEISLKWTYSDDSKDLRGKRGDLG